jgi:transketolase
VSLLIYWLLVHWSLEIAMSYSDSTIKALESKAKVIRRHIVEMVAAAGSGHPGGSLSAADLVTALYFHVLG